MAKSKYCPACDEQVSYIEKITYSTDNRIIRTYCMKCGKMIEETIYNEKSEEFELKD